MAAIKKADPYALVLIIVGALIVILLQLYKSNDPTLAMFQLAGGILVIIGFGMIVLSRYPRKSESTKKKFKTQRQSILPKTVFCPGCKLMVEPRKIGKLYRCPYCPYEFKSFGEKVKEIGSAYKLVRDIAKD